MGAPHGDADPPARDRHLPSSIYQAAVPAGLGVACPGRWTVPALPPTEIVLQHRPLRPDSAAIVREIAGAYRLGVEGAG